MPVPLPSASLEEIRAPLAIVRRLLADNQAASTSTVPDHFKASLDGKWDQIPLLNDVDAVEQLRPGSLVRFQCMVQNMYNPEWYLGEYDHVNNTTGERVRVHAQYSDAVDVPHGWTVDMSDTVAKTMERVPVHCMSIPHQSAWASSSSSCSSGAMGMESAPATQRAKRSHSDDAMDDEDDAPSGPASGPSAQSGMDCDNGISTDESKRPRPGAAAAPAGISQASITAGGRPVLVPGATQVKHAAIIKLYQEDTSIKVNESYEFVGVLCCDPVTEGATEEEPGMVCSFMENGETAAVQAATVSTGPASSSVIPRIHAVAFRQLTPKWNPALDNLAPAQQACRRTELANALPAVRARVVKSLANALLGDTLAAEYLLCHMLSRVYHRAHGVPVGKLSLAITGVPPTAAAGTSATQDLVAVMQTLLPAVAYVPMSVKHLSSKLMAPKKDYDTEMLHTGDLQMTPSTQVLCDETAMEAGNLNETGLKNLHSLQQLATFQHLLFDFSFYQMEFPTDVPVLVTSQGKPLMTTDMVLKLCPDAQAAAAVRAELQATPDTEDMLQLCRIYLSLARSTDVGLSDDLCKVAEEKFVKARQADDKVDQETLGRWLTLAKLLAASYGSTDLKKEHWDQMVVMEAQRAARVAV